MSVDPAHIGLDTVLSENFYIQKYVHVIWIIVDKLTVWGKSERQRKDRKDLAPLWAVNGQS